MNHIAMYLAQRVASARRLNQGLVVSHALLIDTFGSIALASKFFAHLDCRLVRIERRGPLQVAMAVDPAEVDSLPTAEEYRVVGSPVAPANS